MMKRDLKTVAILMRASRRIEDIIRQDIQAHGLTLSEFGTLEALFHKGTLTVAEVIEKILVPHSSMSYVIERLLEKGLIEKKQDDDDRRVYRLSLTKTGSDYVAAVYPIHEKALRTVLDSLSEQEEETFSSRLRRNCLCRRRRSGKANHRECLQSGCRQRCRYRDRLRLHHKYSRRPYNGIFSSLPRKSINIIISFNLFVMPSFFLYIYTVI